MKFFKLVVTVKINNSIIGTSSVNLYDEETPIDQIHSILNKYLNELPLNEMDDFFDENSNIIENVEHFEILKWEIVEDYSL